MARAAAKSPAPPVQSGGLQCPYCLSNLRPERASIATGDVEGNRSALRVVPRTDEAVKERAAKAEPKRKVALSGKVDPDWSRSGKGKAGKP